MPVVEGPVSGAPLSVVLVLVGAGAPLVVPDVPDDPPLLPEGSTFAGASPLVLEHAIARATAGTMTVKASERMACTGVAHHAEQAVSTASTSSAACTFASQASDA